MPKKSDKFAELVKKVEYKKKNVWDGLSPEQTAEIFNFCEGYKDFLNQAKTEREAVKTIIGIAVDHGFADLEKGKNRSGKYYFNYRGKVAVLARIGKKPLKAGVKIVCAHIDSPRLDLKQNPLYQEQDLAMFKTHYYGGIKKYQWLARPLAIHGVIILKGGTTKEIVVGESENDPIFSIEDLLPHLDKKLREKKISEAFEGEKLNVIIGSQPLPDEKRENRFKLAILKLMNDQYGITESDFQSAEIEIVPAGKARDLGLDKSMVASYGQDDRVCAYSALRAILEVEKSDDNLIAMFVDKEEIGSYGNTGADSRFPEYLVGKLLDVLGQDGRPLEVLAHSEALSADVNGAIDPDYPDVHEKMNAAKLGYGVCVTKFTGSGGKYSSSDASAEFVGKIRKIFDDKGVIWQTGELGKVDEGGGGTIALYFATFGMDILDVGTPLLSMHSPLEIASKGDVWNTYKGYRAFYED
jgi:aspartyl aminopeptidase